MAEEIVKYQSGETYSNTSFTFPAAFVRGTNCSCKVFTETVFDPLSGTNKDHYFMSWKFEWNESKKSNVIGYKGDITAFYKNSTAVYVPTKFEIEMKRSGQSFERFIATSEKIPPQSNGYRYWKYEFALTPIYGTLDTCKLAENFKSLAVTDSVLVVDEQKIHVNKAFLSCQSEFFSTLFNSEFKEKYMNEVPIKDVKYGDFALFLSVIHPNPIPPTDETAPKLLELANRFLMPAVTCHVESYLLSSSLDITEKFCLADKYDLKRLVEKCALELKTQRQLEKITRSEYFESFSQDTQYKILQRYLSIL